MRRAMPATPAHCCTVHGCTGRGLVLGRDYLRGGLCRRRLQCQRCGNRWSVEGTVAEWQPRNHRPVINLDTGVIYPNICAAGRSIYVIRGTIAKAIGMGRLCGGYLWQYVDQLPAAAGTSSPIAG
jgi:hypothetical protein